MTYRGIDGIRQLIQEIADEGRLTPLIVIADICDKLKEKYTEVVCQKSRAYHALALSTPDPSDPPVDTVPPTSEEIIQMILDVKSKP